MSGGFYLFPHFFLIFFFHFMTTQTIIQKSTFKKDWKFFFKKIINQRSVALDNNRSLKNPTRMKSLVDYFLPYVGYNFNEIGTAKFIIKYKSEIREIMVSGNNLTETRLSLFITQANSILEL